MTNKPEQPIIYQTEKHSTKKEPNILTKYTLIFWIQVIRIGVAKSLRVTKS